MYDSLKYKYEKFSYEKEFRIVFDLSKYSVFTGYEKEIIGKFYIEDLPSYENDEFTSSMSDTGRKNAFDVISKKEGGYIFKYQLDNIITAIKVHPSCSEDALSKIALLCRKKGLNMDVCKSELAK